MKTKISAKPNTSERNKTGGWRTFIPEVNLEKCIGCGLCSKICPEGIVEMIDLKNKKKPKINYDFCKGCGACAAECPVKAIEMRLDIK